MIVGPAGELETYLAAPETAPFDGAGLLMLPGFPTDPGGGANSFATLPELADRIADDTGMVVLTVAYRGLAGSEGHFSLKGWRHDIRAGIAHLRAHPDVDKVWLLGFGTGGALSVGAAADDGAVAGVVSVAAPADFQDWASRPRDLLAHARRCGAIGDDDFPEDFGAWAKELQKVSTVKKAEKLPAETAVLVLHGTNDDAVPLLDARAIADAHIGTELKVIDGGRHHLRHDPRAMALAIGFLSRRGERAVRRQLVND